MVGVGVDGLHSSGKLDELGINKGPIFWVDSADSQPCVGTVGNLQWTMKANGKLFHSGLPHMVSAPLSPWGRGDSRCPLFWRPRRIAMIIKKINH